MLQRKFANMIVRTWESDCINYMVTGSIDTVLSSVDKSSDNYYDIVQKVIEDHGIEASISKIVGSEALAYAVDEGVQIMGGAGFIEEYPMATMYRDERINRIFEGTNEINKLIIGGTTLKKAIMEEIPLRDIIFHRSQDWLPSINLLNHEYLSDEARAIEYCRSFTLFVLHESILQHGQDLKNEHQIVEMLSDIFTDIYTAESTIIRVKKIMDSDKPIASTVDIAKTFTTEMVDRVLANTHSILHAIYQGPAPADVNKKIKQFEERMRLANNVVQSKRNIAEYVFDQKEYPY